MAETSKTYYNNSWQHIVDELARLDLLVQLKINEIKFNVPQINNPDFKGIFITDNEVEQLLSPHNDVRQEDNIEFKKSTELILNSLRQIDSSIAEKLKNSEAKGIKLAQVELANLFDLSEVEHQIIIILLAPEINRKYEKIYGYLQDDITQKWASLELLILLNNKQVHEIRELMLPDSRLMNLHIVERVEDIRERGITELSTIFRLNTGIVNYLLGIDATDERITDYITAVKPSDNQTDLFGYESAFSGLHQLVNSGMAKQMDSIHLINLYGPNGTGKKSFIKKLCGILNKELIILHADKILDERVQATQLFKIILREALLNHTFLLVDKFDSLNEELQQSFLSIVKRALFKNLKFVFITGDKPWFPLVKNSGISISHIAFKLPEISERSDFWKYQLNGKYKQANIINLNEIATKFRFSQGQIKASIETARNLEKTEESDEVVIHEENLYRACRIHSGRNLESLAQLIKSDYGWKDIVLPKETIEQLKAIESHVKYHNKVFNIWGFNCKSNFGKGINALFHGQSGTGKTMAAGILANSLRLNLYRIDLSQIVSKYIGETEKNLDKIFNEAETSNAILFFDEADALFGKRTEIKDSHDRYANIEVSYLLQKMESYEGLSLLATNLAQNIDDAFTRRLRFIIEFPFPEVEYRKKIWKKVFPETISKKVKIDYNLLANKLKITGGNIRNIAVNAAFRAAAQRRKLTMNHIIDAAKDEYKKMGRVLHNAELFTDQKQITK